jgi:hypothetical protein
MEEEIIAQLGLLFTQMRLARRALDSIERNTAVYRGVAFATALSAGSRFGEPPLLNGALKVYIVNINDLTSGGSGFIEGILGGVGRFIGGMFGGLIGGTIGGIALPYNLAKFARIAEAIDRILDRLGIGTSSSSAAALGRSGASGTATSQTQAGAGGGSGGSGSGTGGSGGTTGGTNLASIVPRITETVNALTNMFRTGVAPSQISPQTTVGTAVATGAPTATSAGGGMPILEILQVVSGMVNGLILLVPMLIGAFASLLIRIDDIKLAIVDMLQFVMRIAFLLAGVVLVTLSDTIAAAARLAGNLMSIVGTLVGSVLGSIFRIIGALLNTSLEAIRFVLDGIRNTVNALMLWLRDGLGNLLIFFGNTRVFRLIFHLVDILPLILPSLHHLIRGGSITPAEAAALTAAAARPVPGPGVAGAGGPIAAFPNLANTLLPPADVARLTGSLTTAGSTVTSELRNIFGTATGALNAVGGAMNDAVSTGGFNAQLQTHIGTVEARATALAGVLAQARTEAAQRPQTGLEAIAHAYEGWLTGGGFDTLMQRITDHFARTPTVGADVAATIPGQVVASVGTTASRARATVEIGEVTIEIAPPPTDLRPEPRIYQAEFDLDTWRTQLQEFEDRGGVAPAFA